MKQYILTLSLALCSIFGGNYITAQELNDSTKTKPIDLPFGQVSENRLVGAVDVITSEQLMHSGYPTLSAALQGLAPGYVLGKVRGYSRGGSGDGPLVIIDGLSNRSMGSLTLEEVESVHILKDITAKMLYGNRAANGVIVIKTKRGVNAKKKLTFTGEYGIRMADDNPEYFGAADYMGYRNQALMNDGKDPLYEQTDMDMSGSSYKYPDVDYYDTFAEDKTNFQKINAQLIGGDEKTKYFFNLGYLGEDGMEKVGDKTRVDVLNVRSNLDYAINDVISINLDIAGRFNSIKGNRAGNMWSALSGSRPNDYPMFISDAPHIDSLGTSDKVGGYNLYGAMVYSGYARQQTSYAQTNIGMSFDLDKYIKGLSAKAYATFDINNYISEGKILSYRTLKPALTALGEDTLIVNGVASPKGNEEKFADSYYRNMGGGANITYDRVFNDHAVTADFSYLIDNKTVKTDASEMLTIQDDKSMNFGMRLNYAYQNKYVAEMSSSYMGSTRFNEDNRWKLFNAFGLSYIVSEEDFMDNVSFIDFLKVKASYGTIGYDQSFPYLYYNNYYKYYSGSYKTGVKNAETLVGTEFSQSGNPNLTYEESTEMNLGLSLRTLNNKLYLMGEYFKEDRSGMQTIMRYAVPQMAGTPTILDNYNAIENKGFELAAEYTDKVGDFNFSVGGNFTSFESKWTKFDEQNQFGFLNDEGTATDALWGYQADGFYTTPEDIANYGMSYTGPDNNGDGFGDIQVPLTSTLGNVIPGDLRLVDLTDGQSEYNLDDNVINFYDQKVIGNTRPRYVYSLHVNLNYKNVSFYALGQGYGGYDRMNSWFSYYTNKGNVKYSKFAADAAVPTFDADGNAIGLADNNYSLPRLSSEGSAHSYGSNTFFKESVNYFKVRTVELNYHFPEALSRKIAAQSLDIYVKGDNLLTLSEQKDWDPESPSAGISGSPRFATISFGLKLGF